jgi:hypothetical protein
VLVLDKIEILPHLGKYKYDTWIILSVKCYINNSMRLRSCIRNINKHFWHRCRVGSQFLLSIYRLHRIILTRIISITDLSAAMCLFMVFIGSCMTRFDLPANYHSNPESLIRKSRSRLSSLGSSGSHIREIVDKFQGSPLPHEPTLMAARGASMISQLHLVPTLGLVRRRTLEMAILDLNQLSTTWCSKAHSAVRPWRMLILIFNTSWRFAAHSLFEE